MNHQPAPEILTVGQVGDLFAVDPKTVTRWAKLGKFPAGTIFRTPGGHRRYYGDKVRSMLTDLGYRNGA